MSTVPDAPSPRGVPVCRPVPIQRSAAALANDALLTRVSQLARCEREASADLVAHLAELDLRRLYLGEGFSSMFAYCTAGLGLSEHGAYNRIETARASRSFPLILELLADGAVNLTTLRLLAPHLTPDNHVALLGAVRGRSKREVEEMLSGVAPQPDAVTLIRRVSDGSPAPLLLAGPMLVGAPTIVAASDAAADAIVEPLRTPPRPPLGHAVFVPLSPERYRFQFTVGKATHDKLRRLQTLLRREIPDGDPATIFDRALTLLLERIERKKFGLTNRPRTVAGGGVAAVDGGTAEVAGTGTSSTRDIPDAVKRAVTHRDRGQCAYVSPSGRRCGTTEFLEFHHLTPYAVGGPPTVENISLRCQPHNKYEAELFFGPCGNSPRGELPSGSEDGDARGP